jgi:hypothetical protein
MKLIDIAANLHSLDENLFICACRPWNESAEFELVPIDSTLTVPEEATKRGLDYFLEVSVAREVCEVFGGRKASATEIASLLLLYAENDSYPEWVYEG